MKKKIPSKTTLRCLRSVAFMNHQDGAAFNGMVTVNFRQLGVSGERDASLALTKLNEALSDKLRRYGERWDYVYPHYFLYAHEDVSTSNGHHLHQLVVVPRGLGVGEDLDGWLKGWAHRNFGEGVHPRAIQYEGEYHRDLDERVKNQARLVSYILKSSEDRPVRSLGGEPTSLLTLFQSHSRKWKGDRSYCAPVNRVAASSENIAELAQMKCVFWGAPYVEDVLNGAFLRDYQAALRADELTEMLRKLAV